MYQLASHKFAHLWYEGIVLLPIATKFRLLDVTEEQSNECEYPVSGSVPDLGPEHFQPDHTNTGCHHYSFTSELMPPIHAHASHSCLMLDYLHIINLRFFLLLLYQYNHWMIQLWNSCLTKCNAITITLLLPRQSPDRDLNHNLWVTRQKTKRKVHLMTVPTTVTNKSLNTTAVS